MPVLVGSWHTIDGLVSSVSGPMRSLVEAFWPGGLTLVVEHAPSLAWDLGDARGTVAIRMPLHPIALDLLAETGPMAVSSANVSGQPPAVTAQQAYEWGAVNEVLPKEHVLDRAWEIARYLARFNTVTLRNTRRTFVQELKRAAVNDLALGQNMELLGMTSIHPDPMLWDGGVLPDQP